MVIQATIYRVQDGLPLSASTDVDQRPQVRTCQKYVKMMSKRLAQLPNRCSLHLDGFHVNCISTMNTAFMVMCETSYPSVLAFSFLEEIQKEFLIKYTAEQVSAARRPYAFIEFDISLQKTKQRFNKTRSLASRINLADMTMELKLRPPYTVTEDDLGLGVKLSSNGVASSGGTSHRPTVGPGQRLVPLNWLGYISVALNVVCSIINVMRGMTIIGHGHFDEDDAGAYRYGTTFLFSAILFSIQVYHMFYVARWRRLQILGLLLLHAWCNHFLADFRNFIQIAFHMGTALFASAVMYSRQLSEKLPGYSV